MSQPRAFSVQSKLLAAFVLLTVAAITVLTAVGYLTARASLTTAVERQLVGLQRSKSGIVKATADLDAQRGAGVLRVGRDGHRGDVPDGGVSRSPG